MGEIVYNNFMPKIFARARVFKLVNDEKYRIECQVQMCTMDGVCKDRIFPPKCAFTKEEILNRYMAKPRIDSIEDTIMTGTINNRYERQVKVASEWITVHNNQYTNIEQLHERYYLSTVMNDKMEDTKGQPVMRHFLMGISYRQQNASNNKGKSKQPSAVTTSTTTASTKTKSKTEATRLRQTTQKPKTTTSRTSTTPRTSTTTRSLNQGWRGSRTSTAKPFPKEDIVESTTKVSQTFMISEFVQHGLAVITCHKTRNLASNFIIASHFLMQSIAHSTLFHIKDI
ncbi:hypothetical protein ANCCAN_18462 [Ancylostoma caninum]|uniref:ZP domain-containing protein n=1 Tax=Ancylostoma caninum TaxID=29170 RepID=A0A368FY06_ANCCA|nr:hypothetical protein ANCCAN_18462 [Ancylostoma caninum]